MNSRHYVKALLAVVVVCLTMNISTDGADAQSERDWGEELETCVAERRSLLAVFLVDESGSLRDTDPENQRLPAVQVGVRSLGDLAEGLNDQGGQQIDLQITILGFASIVSERVPWSSPDAVLDSEGLVGIAERNLGQETDYVNALIGVLEAFRTKSAELNGSTGVDPCKILFWFTDGKFEISVRSSSATATDSDDQKVWAPDFDLFESVDGILDVGKSVICEATDFATPGLVDQLRDAGVVSITLALTRQIDQVDKDFLISIAQNPSDNSCGVVPAVGAAEEADEVTQLSCELATPVDGTQVSDQCAEGEFDPVIVRTLLGDPGMDRLRAVISSTADFADVVLRTPSGEQIPISDGLVQEENGADIEADVTAGRVAVVDIDFDPTSSAWIGEWSIVASSAPGARGFSQITYWGDYLPAASLDREVLRLGDPGNVVIDVTTSAGQPVDASTFAAFEIDVVALASSAEFGPATLEGSRFLAAIDTSAAAVGVVTLETSITATTQGGIQLQPVSRRNDIEISPPPGYPKLLTDRLLLPTLTGTGDVSFVLEIQGAEETDGCVWFGDHDPDPSTTRLDTTIELDKIGPGSAETCAVVPAGEVVELLGVVRVSDSVQGRYLADVGVNLQARTDMPVVQAVSELTFLLDKPVDPARRNWILVLMLAGGLLVPLAVTALVNWVAARFRTGGRVKHLVVPVIVHSGRLQPAPGFSFKPVDRSKFVLGPENADRSRRFTAGGFDFSSRTSINPFVAPVGHVSSASEIVVSSAGRAGSPSKRLSRAGAHLALPNQWFLEVQAPPNQDPADGTVEDATMTGTLMIIVAIADETEAQRLVDRALADAPVLVQAALEMRPESERPQASTQGDDGESAETRPFASSEAAATSAPAGSRPPNTDNPWN